MANHIRRFTFLACISYYSISMPLLGIIQIFNTFTKPNLNTMKYLFITLVLTSSIISAQWQDAISGNATLDSIHQQISKFDTIEVLGPFEITLQKGNRHKVTIVGESNLIPYVEFDVNKNKLCILIEKPTFSTDHFSISTFHEKVLETWISAWNPILSE